MNLPAANKNVQRQEILESAKERLIEKEVDYVKKVADLDVKLVLKKCESAIIEQGRSVGLHQITLEEHQILVRQANNKASQAIGEIDALQAEVERLKTQTIDTLKELTNILDTQEEEITSFKAFRLDVESGYFYRLKKFFKNLFNRSPT